jgi:NADH pyrophosphatase NudC (nudix superfamily)
VGRKATTHQRTGLRHRVWTQQDVLELRLFLVDRAATCPLTTLEDRGLAMVHKMCEDCREKHAISGTLAEGKKRWCGPCGKARGAVNLQVHKMCEDCGEKHASFGTPTMGKKRWCGPCGKAHSAVNLQVHKMCEDCKEKHASCGTPTEVPQHLMLGALSVRYAPTFGGA